MASSAEPLIVAGSSPLTRGKPGGVSVTAYDLRLIPAHAGKTSRRWFSPEPRTAHPRSRGENRAAGGLDSRGGGSSPLTRGKLASRSPTFRVRGLIPAHAGKTSTCGRRSTSWTAHPRSRGENFLIVEVAEKLDGSSPLTRGKPVMHIVQRLARRLIPAHAGKTLRSRFARTSPTAHPRSRGENERDPYSDETLAGSSPLTRGKLDAEGQASLRGRLIPAHAGKTCHQRRPGPATPAHPRSRGENSVTVAPRASMIGSSPLTRGKPLGALGHLSVSRLIPAHAGKTQASARTPACMPAHPRSRGENSS